MPKKTATPQNKFSKGDKVWMAFDESPGVTSIGQWQWRQVEVVGFDPKKGVAGEYQVKTGSKETDIKSIGEKELEGWQNLKTMQ